jgi:hypothetical protein
MNEVRKKMGLEPLGAPRIAFSIPDGWMCPECNIEMDNIMTFCHKCREPRPDHDEDPPDQYEDVLEDK